MRHEYQQPTSFLKEEKYRFQLFKRVRKEQISPIFHKNAQLKHSYRIVYIGNEAGNSLT